MFIRLEPSLRDRFPDLTARVVHLQGASISRRDPVLEEYKEKVMREVVETWSPEDLREHRVFRAYRDFFWSLDIDPTKIRPASEALIRRTLRGNPIPHINTFVDSYNLASMLTLIPLAAFDEDVLVGEPLMRAAREGEKFRGIGMKRDIILDGGEVVIQDDEKLIAIYPYRDADSSKITLNTENVFMLICGVPGIDAATLKKAETKTIEIVTRFCGGTAK